MFINFRAGFGKALVYQLSFAFDALSIQSQRILDICCCRGFSTCESYARTSHSPMKSWNFFG